MNITLDGYMSGPNCELDWHFNSWTPDMVISLCEQLDKADTILLGRVTYNAMANYWPDKVNDFSFPREDIAFAEMMNNYAKVVFSKTLEELSWNNSRLAKGNTRQEIVKLKQQPGKDMIIYGSGKLVSSLHQWGLIDEYILWVHPVVLGKGKPFFKNLQESVTMKLINTKKFSSGVVVLSYEMW
jgi:dihydrofolate reductase